MVSLKRNNATEDTARARQRIKPTAVTMTPLRVSNVKSGETVHQQCLLIKGECPTFDNSDDDYISVKTSDSMKVAESSNNWPVYRGAWKALVLLAPGNNTITLSLHHAGGAQSTSSLLLVYQPLLQIPPLHLAIMVAKDSPLVIDCPPSKYGAISSAHNSLESVIAKFRMTAYMWQALTAEDMQQKELGRRTFRFEEEWTADTTSFQTFRANAEGATIMKSLPKLHIVRTEKTVAELRDANVAQQNPHARRPNELHEIFTRALKAYGGPFESGCRPVVAGLILDSCYSLDRNMILGHAALGCHQRNALSLGMFGSHLTYSWPRSMEEVSSCLLDATPPGETVGNDNGECVSMARACFIGQGAFLHEVGHAFGADHTEGIMKRGYSKGWGTQFLDHESLAISSKDHMQDDEAKWALQDVLRFKTLPHFRIPGDEPITKDFVNAEIQVKVDIDGEGEEWLCITSKAGLVDVKIQNGSHNISSNYSSPGYKYTVCDFRTRELSDFERSTPLEVSVLAQNGKERIIKNAWSFFKDRTFIRIPGSDVRLQKTSVKSSRLEEDDDEDNYIPWTALLNKANPNGNHIRASAIDLRVGCTFDGAVVYYVDGTYAHCGPTREHGQEHHFGGHASEQHDLPANAKIVKVEVNKSGGWSQGSLDGIRITLDDGVQWGEINSQYSDVNDIHVFEPDDGEVVVGFFGKHEKNGFTEEFGIITAPKDFVIPTAAYELPELKNNLVQTARPRPAADEDDMSEDIENTDGEDDDEMNSQDTM
ncbi:hypothetical protein M409DRAFT_15890 [Zasmidium cellare ATCC 36951]|uniref:Jacalin-type lectin domain-containing protein n=1 Tax=Zasmidium cellare ATCC 36951 TaxID=1080233 RepID=A0A6A6D5X1_ZASCE|nr:uncharacterized protein M409DRAFT_15890 [Zasmidium cellare ATCC 36951]KAF2173612.1 hypothetical protein M409DRAFT_15890 [Zasmidium cellare ATCC 36951]